MVHECCRSVELAMSEARDQVKCSVGMIIKSKGNT